jgi:hypothetical protein
MMMTTTIMMVMMTMKTMAARPTAEAATAMAVVWASQPDELPTAKSA